MPNESNKTEYDSKGIAPSFESHFKEPKRNFKIASSLEMLQQVLTSGFTNLEVFLKENQIENSKLHHHLLLGFTFGVEMLRAL